MQEARRSLTTARLPRIVTLRLASRSPRGAFAALALAVLVAIAAISLATAGLLSRARQPGGSALVAAAGPAPDYTSDYGTAFDPFVIANSQRRSVPAPSDSGSDYGTAYDPFVIENSRVRYTPVAPAADPASDYGTEFDPFVVENSRPRYTGR